MYVCAWVYDYCTLNNTNISVSDDNAIVLQAHRRITFSLSLCLYFLILKERLLGTLVFPIQFTSKYCLWEIKKILIGNYKNTYR